MVIEVAMRLWDEEGARTACWGRRGGGGGWRGVGAADEGEWRGLRLGRHRLSSPFITCQLLLWVSRWESTDCEERRQPVAAIHSPALLPSYTHTQRDPHHPRLPRPLCFLLVPVAACFLPAARRLPS